MQQFYRCDICTMYHLLDFRRLSPDARRKIILGDDWVWAQAKLPPDAEVIEEPRR